MTVPPATHPERSPREAWRAAREALGSGDVDLLVFDEVTYPMSYGWLDTAEVVAAIGARAPGTHVICTGRDVAPELVAAARTPARTPGTAP